MRTGVLGGTFDPIHLGHLAVAEAARECGRLDRLILVPAGRPPHRGAALAAAEDRLEMCRLAASRRAGLQVADIELQRPGASYTADTLRQLRALHADDDLLLVLGWDAAREIGSWHEPAVVMDLARVIIVPRPGLAAPTDEDLVRAGLDPCRSQVCLVTTPDIQATEIRRRAATGASLGGLVDPAVEAYIRSHRLYSDPQLLASNR